MRKLLLLGIVMMTTSMSYGQQTMDKNGIITNSEEMESHYLGETVRLSSLPIDTTLDLPIKKHPKLGYHPKGDWFLNPTVNPNALPKNGDPVLQKEYNTSQNRSTQIANWAGMNTNTNPGDPALDVGPNHVVQMMNGASGARVQIWDKTGTVLAGPINFSTLSSGTWSGLGDPIVLYDQRADRWILTEFCSGCNNMYIAISTTPDPTGTYNTFSVAASSFPDYPKYSIWDNSYLITANEGTTTSSVYILDRTSMLGAGSPNARRFTVPRFGTIGFQATTPVSLLGTVPSGTPSMLMRMRDDAWSGSATDALEIWELDINWSNPTAATLTQVQTLNTSPHESELCGYTSFACIPQQGSSTTLDPLRELLMNRIMYRNFGSHESMVCAHVTDVDGNDLAGIRWYELRRTGGGTGTWSIYQEGTYSPSDGLHRWMPTIGISASGNIGLAYNVSGSSAHPEIRYTGRKECDPLGVMTETEIQLVDGTSPNNSNRWGDYNAMGVDPTDGETFWFTATYNPTTQARSRVGAFKITTCSAQVQFANSSYTVNEPDANVSNGCLDYYTLMVPISITVDPSQPADITINVTGGTATQNIDYTISNTSFTLDGTTLVGNVQLNIYNDNNTEGNETITLDYTLNSNGGDAAPGTINQSVTITIIDDDLDPNSMFTTSVIYSEDFESGFGAVTTVNSSGDTPFQIGNEASAQSTAYNIPSDNATQFAWVNDDDCNCDQSDVDLILPVVDLSNYTGATLSFISYFEDNTYSSVNEDADLMVSISGGTFTTVAPLVASIIDNSWTSQSFDISAYVGNSSVQFAINYSDGGGWLYGCSVDDLLITGVSPISIQTVVNTGSGKTGNLGPNETVHFYDPASGDVMLSIVNTSTFDYGCVTVEVDRDGTTPTALPFASNTVADYLHGKTYKVTPTNNSATGTFNITLYYEEAEVTQWESITGNSRSNLEIIKVAGNNRINDVTPANYASYTIDNPTASLGNFNGDVTLTASFSNGFSGFGAGIYNITTVTVTHTTSFTNPLCNGSSDGTISITASGGTAPYQYSIDGGTTWSSSNSFGGLSASTYSVMVQDAGMNTSTATSVTLTNPPAITLSSSVTNPNCNTGTGSISIVASGGTGTLQYSVNGGTSYQSSGNFTSLSGGTYNLVVQDANNCQATGIATISIPSAITFTSSTTDEHCGNADGSISISASGGTGTLQYSINGGTSFQTATSFSGLSGGNYNVVVQDANNCQATSTVNVPINNGPTITSVTPTNITCFGGNNGSIVINASGSGPLEYSIDGGSSWQTSNNFSGLAAATYNLYIRDIYGCQLNIGTLSLTQPSQITYSTSITNSTCGGSNGAINFTASGGTGTLQYSINGGGSFQSSTSFPGRPAGSYNVVIRDGNGCQVSGVVSIGTTGGPAITNESFTNISCNGNTDGSISITATGAATLTYSINGGVSFQTSGNFTGLSSGSYTIVVKDGNNCTSNGSILTLTAPTGISFSTSTTDATCGNSDGTITISATGGTGTLQYSLNGGTLQASNGFTGLSSGNYTIEVEDANGCLSNGSVTINNTSGPVITDQSFTNISCNGANDGSISLSASGTAALSYSINGGTTYQSSGSFTNLAPGSYTISVQDGNGCSTAGSTITISSPAALTFSSSSSDASCGNNNGSITLLASGGSTPIMYSINGGTSYQSGGSFNALSPGSYSIMIKDNNNCQISGTITVGTTSGPTIGSEVPTHVSCAGGNDGTITITASGSGTIEYSIDGGTTFQTSGSFTNLTAGVYNISVRDGSGCSTTGSTLTVVQPNAINYATNVTDASCGASDGSMIIMATGGTGSYLYSIDGGSNFQTNGTFTGLSSGNYSILVQDINNCNVSGIVTINNVSGPVITNLIATDESCFNANDGSVQVVATGSNLTYSFNGGSFQSSNILNGTTGNVSVIVQDAAGCTTTGSVFVNAAIDLTLSTSSQSSTCGIPNGMTQVNATGGTGNYSYLWNDPLGQTNNVATGLSEGTYVVVVTDGNGCIDSAEISISSISSMLVNVEVVHESCPGEADGSITTEVTGGTAPYDYVWSNGDTTSIVTNLSVGSYTLNVSDAHDCVVSLIIPIENENGDCIEIPTAISPNGDGANDTWIISGLEDYPDATVEIYNRWGSLLFSSKDYQNDWDATYNGENISAGVYYYVITIDEDTTYTGSITVIR